jgi:hypothetical protein
MMNMGIYASEELSSLLCACIEADSSYNRGAALENLVERVFLAVPSVKLVDRDVKDECGAQEIDLVFSHFHPISELPIPDVTIIIECKNEKSRTSAAHVREFASKLRSRGMGIGVLVTFAGLAGDRGQSAHAAIRDSLGERVAIIVVTAHELAALQAPEDLAVLLTRRLNELRTLRGYRSV